MKRNENCYGCHEIPIKVIHKGVYKVTKLCLTCNIARPFRSNHCSDCDNCTIRFDHHCPWIGGCVAKRNYIYFFSFLTVLNIRNIFLVTFSIICICKNINKDKDRIEVLKDLTNLIPTLFTIIFILITMLFTTGLLFYHIRLIIKNRTTKEEIKNLIYNTIGNPYDRGCNKNCNEFLKRHKAMKNYYTVKDLCVKVTKEKAKTQIIAKGFTPAIKPYNQNDNQITKKEEENQNNKEEMKDSNKLENGQKEKTVDLDGKNKVSEKNSKKRKNNKSSNQSNNNDEIDDVISEENVNDGMKTVNSAIKNRNNLNNIISDKINNYENHKQKIGTYMNEKNKTEFDILKNQKGHKIEDLSSEVSINEEIKYLKSSISIPKEESFFSSLSQN
jgi:hypothetical protein